MNTALYQDTKQPMWLNLLVAEIACIVFFLPAARFHLTFFGFSITTGYEMYKVFYIPILTWLYWRWRNREKPIPSSPFFLPLVVFFCVSVFSSLSCMDMYESLTESLEILLYIIFFLILLDIP
ncbi:hypothetical protein GF373_13720, partial [bacterium]|nr:hypothetical protein [bacterium]